MKKIIFALIVIFCCIAVGDYMFNYNKPNVDNTEHYYIAHAGGELNGVRYTNSLEAVENAINHGIKYIELDLALTSDGKLVCLHDWASFKKKALGVECDDTAVRCEEYKVLTDSILNRGGTT